MMAVDIRTQQIEAMSEEKRREFDRRMAERLRRRWESASQIAPAALVALATRGRERARQHGIYLPDDIERFLGYLLRYGASFGQDETTRWAAPILRRSAQPGRDKLDALEQAEPAREAPCP